MSKLSFKASCATGSDWQAVARNCMQEVGTEPSNANFGFLYITDSLAPYLQTLLDEFRQATGIKDWIGTVGAGICCSGREIYDEPAAAIMLATLPENSYRLFPSGISNLSDMLKENQTWIDEHAVHFGVVHGDPRNSHIGQIIDSLSTELDPGFLVGGLTSASDDSYMQQIAGEICEDGLSGVLLSAEIPVISGLTQGCTPLTNKHTITRSEGNILAELDGRPALDVFKEDIGEVLAKDLSGVATPDTLLRWFRQLVAKKYDGSASLGCRPEAGG